MMVEKAHPDVMSLSAAGFSTTGRLADGKGRHRRWLKYRHHYEKQPFAASKFRNYGRSESDWEIDGHWVKDALKKGLQAGGVFLNRIDE